MAEAKTATDAKPKVDETAAQLDNLGRQIEVINARLDGLAEAIGSANRALLSWSAYLKLPTDLIAPESKGPREVARELHVGDVVS